MSHYNHTLWAHDRILSLAPGVDRRITDFCFDVLETRGGRLGSGMGTLLEALWGYFMNQALLQTPEDKRLQIAWIQNHEYNDFACVWRSSPWNPDTGANELLRIEIKSMVRAADEPKAHFDVLQSELTDQHILVVLVWDWAVKDHKTQTIYPYIAEGFCHNAAPLARFRDALHLARGGSFVTPDTCPERQAESCSCRQGSCHYEGEPLNASKSRERLSGPPSAKPAGSTHAQNFGGMKRMVAAQQLEAKRTRLRLRSECPVVDQYMRFLYRNLPDLEETHYTSEWSLLYSSATGQKPSSKKDAVEWVRKNIEQYEEKLYELALKNL